MGMSIIDRCDSKRHLGHGLQVLFWKKRAEEAIQRSGITYTIVRPGGLTNEPRGRDPEGRIVMGGPDTFGLPPRRRSGSILRRQVDSLAADAASSLSGLSLQAVPMDPIACKTVPCSYEWQSMFGKAHFMQPSAALHSCVCAVLLKSHCRDPASVSFMP